jgi:hypothetical protein
MCSVLVSCAGGVRNRLLLQECPLGLFPGPVRPRSRTFVHGSYKYLIFIRPIHYGTAHGGQQSGSPAGKPRRQFPSENPLTRPLSSPPPLSGVCDLPGVPSAAAPHAGHGILYPGSSQKQTTFDTVLVWLRRDLRLDDNPALFVAAAVSKTVIPVYIWAADEEGQFQPGKCSRWWLHEALNSLQHDLEKLGSRLVLRKADDSYTGLEALARETGAQAVFFNHLYDPISLVRDNEVKAMMASKGIHW